MSWGRGSKMPSMTKTYQGPMYIDIVEENVSPPDSMPLISTYVYDYDNEYLKGYQNEKAEIALDVKVGQVAFILTGFYDETNESPRLQNDPITLYRYRWEGYPDPGTRAQIDTIHTDNDNRHGHYAHVGFYRKYGAEFQFLTKRIESISAVFRFDGSYYESRSGAEGTYISSPRQNEALGRTIYPLFTYTERGNRKMIVNYKADWLIKSVGIWVTFHIQQTLFEARQNVVNPDSAAAGYYDPTADRTVHITPEESSALGLNREYDHYDTDVRTKPNDRILFNLNVSKSLGKTAEVSMFVHNFFNDPAYYVDEKGMYHSRNHSIFFGIEFSVMIDNLLR